MSVGDYLDEIKTRKNIPGFFFFKLLPVERGHSTDSQAHVDGKRSSWNTPEWHGYESHSF
jgi:hypothetical protein